MGVATQQVRIGGMLVDPPHRLVKGHRRQSAGVDIGHEIVAVPKVLLAVSRTGCKATEIVEGLVMRLEVCGSILARIDHLTLFGRGSAPIRKGYAPSTAVPCPIDALSRE